MTDPRQTLDEAAMSHFQIVAVLVCVAVTALDGFDVLSISFAAPGIAREWNIDRAALGVVLSMELIGMAVGSIVIGALADRFGRRPAILACLSLMTAGMALAATAQSVFLLSAIRFLTGLGIGGVLAATNAMVAEYANLRSRSLAVAAMATGYPLGAAMGGSIVAVLLAHYDWRSVFVLGAVLTLATIPAVYFLLPESIESLIDRRPPRALERVNALLRRMGRPPVAALPEVDRRARRNPAERLFAPDLALKTVFLTAAYFAHIVTFYFILKWTPKIVVDLGYSPSEASGVLVWTSIGGAVGATLLGLASRKMDLRVLIIGAMFFSTASVIAFGAEHSDIRILTIVAATAGFFTNSVIVGLYAFFAQAFPTDVRAGGTGFVIGVGRGGAMLAPIAAGVLFQYGMSLQLVAIMMGCGSILAAAFLIALQMLVERKARAGGERAPAGP
jgi:benzoate transport